MLKIEFEGTDGAGKTTGLKYFIEQAQKLGLKVTETREVGNPSVAACVKLREFVLSPDSNLSGEAMELIFSAMRMENQRWLNQLAQSAEKPDFVVSDRGWYSHLAYTDHNVTAQFTDLLYTGVMKKITTMPNVVVYFAVDTDTALKRRVKRGTGMDVIEMKGVEYQEKVRSSFEKHFLDITLEDNVALYFVNANDTIEGVRSQLDEVLQDILVTLVQQNQTNFG